MAEASPRDPFPRGVRDKGPDLALQMVQLASRETLGQMIVRANALLDVEFNRRVAAELREVELGRELEAAKAEIRDLRRQAGRRNENLAAVNGECEQLRKRVTDLEAFIREKRRAG